LIINNAELDFYEDGMQSLEEIDEEHLNILFDEFGLGEEIL
jgi:hypothetical protein